MKNQLYAAVHTTEYGTDVHLFRFQTSGDHPRPTDNPVKLAQQLGLKGFIEEVDTLIAAPVKNDEGVDVKELPQL